MLLDGVLSSESLDSSGERMSVQGCDITSLNSGKAGLNFEHRSGIKGSPLDLVGRIISAKKIFSEADCANEREKHYWRCVKMPLIYGVARLFDDEGHPGAVSLAAAVRDGLKHNAPIMLGFSIEGSTIAKDRRDLKITVARGCALTIKPANRTCEAGVLDPGMPTQARFDKAEVNRLGTGPTLELYDPQGLADLAKAIEAGSGDVAGGQAVQGAALMKDASGPPAPAPPPLTQRGQALVPHPQLAAARLDEARGILHTPRGSVQLDPGHGLEQFLAHPAVDRLHHAAAAGWERAHALLREGRTPLALAEHAAAVAGLPGAGPTLHRYAAVHRADGQALVGALAQHVAVGGPDHLPGLTPGRARRAAVLMGAGDVLPHDPDVMRHVLGLDKADAQTGAYAGALLDDPAEHHLAAGLDRWYGARHAASQHVLKSELAPALEGGHHVALAGVRHHLAAAALDRARGEGAPPRRHALDAHAHPLAKAEGLTGALQVLHGAYERHAGPGYADVLYLALILPRLLDAAQDQAHAGRVGELLAGAAPRLERSVLRLQGMVPALTGAASGSSGALWPGGPQIRSVGVRGMGDCPVRAGRVMLINGNVEHLEDYHGLLGRLLPAGPLGPDGVARLHALEASPHLDVALDHDYQPPAPPHEGNAPATPPDPPEQSGPDAAAPAAVEAYRYRRAGAEREAILEVSGDQAYLDGAAIPGSLVELMMANAEGGAATLVPAGPLGKAEPWEDLAKADAPMDPGDALTHIRAAVRAGHVHPDVEAALTRHIYTDPMTAEHHIGNKYAASKFLEQKKPGVYVMMDGNDFREINNKHGHAVGDQAIKAMGGALRRAHDEALGPGPGGGKLFRAGGDEFLAHFPSYEHAVKFIHHTRNTFNDLPPIAGQHKISMSFGLGHDPGNADAALYDAKKQKLTPSGERQYPPGHAPMMAHSRVPGREGPIQMHHEAAPTVYHPAKAPMRAAGPDTQSPAPAA